MHCEQYRLTIATQPRQCQLITSDILQACPAIERIECGFLQVFLRHTSASLTINENADPTVRQDFVMALDHIAPEELPYRHKDEGPDDMPAHIKSSLLGASVQIPINRGKLLLGTWQGIYLCEHRRAAHQRELVCTVLGLIRS